MLILLGRTRKGMGNGRNIIVLSFVFGIGQTKMYRKGSACKSVVNVAYTADELSNELNDVLVSPRNIGSAFEKVELLVGFKGDIAVVEAHPTEGAVVTAKEDLIFLKISVKRNYEIAVPVGIGAALYSICSTS